MYGTRRAGRGGRLPWRGGAGKGLGAHALYTFCTGGPGIGLSPAEGRVPTARWRSSGDTANKDPVRSDTGNKLRDSFEILATSLVFLRRVRPWSPRCLLDPLTLGPTVPSGVAVGSPRRASPIPRPSALPEAPWWVGELFSSDLGPSLSLQRPLGVAPTPAVTRHRERLTTRGAGSPDPAVWVSPLGGVT